MTDPLKLEHTFGSLKRAGEWSVPAAVTLRQRLGSASLDFTGATFEETHTELDIDMIGGSVEIRVPADMQVTSDLATTFASYEDHRSEKPVTGRTLAIHGRAVWGSVEVRGPKASAWKRG